MSATHHTLGQLAIPRGMVWVDDNDWVPVVKEMEYSTTGALLVEVIGPVFDGRSAQDRMGLALAAAGLTCHPRHGLIAIDPAPQGAPDVHDVVRDTAADLGVGLVRVQPDHGRIEDVFRDGSGHVAVR